MTTQTQHALKALSIRKRCGRYMARQYAIKHGVMGYYRLVCQLEVMEVVK